MIFDLHTHSTASDGKYSPAALVHAAAQRGLGALALTDHDTINGLDDAAAEAQRCGIQFIPGIEVEVKYPETGLLARRELHVLGLGIRAPSKTLYGILSSLRKNRRTRNLKIISKMRASGINVTLDMLRQYSKTPYIGRPHFAEFLIDQNIAKSHHIAFKKYLGKGGLFYEPKISAEFSQVIGALKDSGGITILAHPSKLRLGWTLLPRILEEIKEQGIDGIEAYHPAAQLKEARRFYRIAAEMGCYITAGSDFHGISPLGYGLGKTSGEINIENKLVVLPASWQDDYQFVSTPD